MADSELLAKLKDIHLPEPISWWPLAPGWYFLLLLVFALTLCLAYFFYKKYRDGLARNRALDLLKSYQKQYEQERNAQLASAQISELLKRVALVYFPRKQVASIHGDDWIDFLNQTSKSLDFKSVKLMLLETPFKEKETINLKPLFVQAEQWIKQRRTPCSN